MICSAIRHQHERFGCSRSALPGLQISLLAAILFAMLPCQRHRNSTPDS
jgi:hypothetical protein